MKPFLSLVFCLFTLACLAKPFRIDVRACDKITKAPLVGVRISFVDEKNREVFSTITDSTGKAFYPNCTAQFVEIVAIPVDKKYKYESLFYSKKSHFGVEQVFEFIDPSKEKALIATKTANTPVDTSLVYSESKCGDGFIHAEFPGGKDAFNSFLVKNLIYPDRALEEAISGTIQLKFLINEDGSVSHLTIQQGMPNCKECEQEVLRVASYFPNYKPASCSGKNVATYVQMPITLKVTY